MWKYIPNESEKKWQDFWEKENVYAFDGNDNEKPVYSIDTPPPTVSGKLHIWHIFSYTQAECVARYKRMKWYNVFYPMGYDDNGIPTEILVEKELWINIKDTPRSEFVSKCLEVNQKYRDVYKSLRQSMGMSVDRNRSYATILPEVQAVSQKHFIELLKRWIIYKKEFPALRCTKNQTTIAQAETEDKEFNEFFNDVRFEIQWWWEIIIATTRPEMMPSCVAVFVHPDDERFSKWIGKNAVTPLGWVVPIMADDKVKMDKWTWAVMCCSYGDEVDTYWIKKYNLPENIVINRYGKMQNTWIVELDGLKIAEAREKIIPIIEAKWALLKRVAIVQSKAVSERWKVAVEIIPVPQWFVKVLDERGKIKKLAGEMNRYPDHMKKRLFDWLDKLQWDWNISRNRKFGIPIPVRYSKKTWEMIMPSDDQFPVDPLSDMPRTLPEWHGPEDVIWDDMVMDTWFTSWLTPQINQEFLKKSGSDINILPMNLRPQAHDIIRTRLLYTTLQSNYATWNKPFENIMMSGHVLAGKWEKISKSKWNAKFEPISLLENFWADATRYWALSGQLGKDMIFDEEALKNWQKLVTKLWNAANFVKMQLEGFDRMAEDLKEDGRWFDLYPTDRWILARLAEVIAKMDKNLDNFEIWLAKIHFEEFFWQDFCDMYLELVKTRVYQPDRFENGQEKKFSWQWTMYHVMYSIIRLLAPYIPHVTEEIYQDFFRQFENTRSLHLTSFPEVHKKYLYMDSESSSEWQAVSNDFQVSKIASSTDKSVSSQWLLEFDIVLQLVSDVRKYKTDRQISLGAEIGKLTISWSTEQLEIIKSVEDDVIGVTKAKEIAYEEGEFGIVV